MQHLITTPSEEAVAYTLCPNVESSARELKNAIFGTQCIDGLDPQELHLQRIAISEIDDKKLKSLQKKYVTIPDNKLGYYPVALANEGGSSDER